MIVKYEVEVEYKDEAFAADTPKPSFEDWQFSPVDDLHCAVDAYMSGDSSISVSATCVSVQS